MAIKTIREICVFETGGKNDDVWMFPRKMVGGIRVRKQQDYDSPPVLSNTRTAGCNTRTAGRVETTAPAINYTWYLEMDVILPDGNVREWGTSYSSRDAVFEAVARLTSEINWRVVD